jgi:hypothetical protein
VECARLALGEARCLSYAMCFFFAPTVAAFAVSLCLTYRCVLAQENCAAAVPRV